MPYQVSLSNLSHMPREAREAAMRDLLRTPERKIRRDLDARIREYELRYEMSTKRMLDRWRSEELEETAEIARWLLLASVQDGEIVR